MRIRKPAQVTSRSITFRPRRALTGKYSIGLSIESSGSGGNAILNWCGSRKQIHFLPQLSSYMTNLRLPVNLSPEDVFVLNISSPGPLTLTLNIFSKGENTDDIAMEVIDGEALIETVCANPATDGDRKFEDALVLGQAQVTSRRTTPVGTISSLRAVPDGAMLYLNFHRPADQTATDLLITASVGGMRRLCIIAAGKTTNGLAFWLKTDVAREEWPLVLYGERAFSWSGAAQRGYDGVFLPAFSLVESEAPKATQ
jgi:hypothetical protein